MAAASAVSLLFCFWKLFVTLQLKRLVLRLMGSTCFLEQLHLLFVESRLQPEASLPEPKLSTPCAVAVIDHHHCEKTAGLVAWRGRTAACNQRPPREGLSYRPVVKSPPRISCPSTKRGDIIPLELMMQSTGAAVRTSSFIRCPGACWERGLLLSPMSENADNMRNVAVSGRRSVVGKIGRAHV